MLLIVLGVILLGLAAGFGFATYQVHRMRQIVRRAGGYDGPEPAEQEPAEPQPAEHRGFRATSAMFRRRLVLSGVLALAGILLIVAGSTWPWG